ncbi:MAG: hypothetical protein KAI70_01155 [Candidatus Omnitrophica bacterium]|nr:hypothetical protein [Candidatus Omnitrophota bacterium]
MIMKRSRFKLFLIFFTIINVIFFTNMAFAETWYVVNQYSYFTESDVQPILRAVTKVNDEERCAEIIEMKKQSLAGAEWINAYYVSGEEYDKALEKVFRGEVVMEAYISYLDLGGYETIVDFIGIPQENINVLAGSVADLCKKDGMFDVKIIFPKKSTENNRAYDEIHKKKGIEIGSTRDEVEALQGKPDSTINNVWFYGNDMVVFDVSERVRDYSNFSGGLKIKDE